MSKILIPLAIGKMGKDVKVEFHGARETYIKKLLTYNLRPIFISSLMPDEMVDSLYAESQGVLLMGGSDVAPAFYNESPHSKTVVTEPSRERCELLIAKKVLTDKKPFLGICRGLQVLAIASGGTLIQHVPDVEKTENHSVGFYDKLLDGPVHEAIVDKNSKLYRLLKTAKIKVTSGHHQSIKTVGLSMKVSATSPAGIVEAIEHTQTDYFCFGIQSHPETEIKGPFEPVFAAFAAAVT